MAGRRRRSLGDSRSVHREMLPVRLRKAQQLAQSAEKSMDRHDCRNAASAMLQAAAAWGSYETHKAGSESSAPGENAVSNEYWATRRRFISTCVLK